MIQHAMAIGITALIQEHFFTFMLSSCFSTRKFGSVDDKTSAEIQDDLIIAIAVGMAIGLLISYMMKSKIGMMFSIGFPLFMTWIYLKRGKL